MRGLSVLGYRLSAKRTITTGFAWAVLTCVAAAQSPLAVDSSHFKLEYEDARVRVIRYRLGVGENSPMHSHGERFVTVISGAKVRITTPDGKVEDRTAQTGAFNHSLPLRHSVQNIGDTPYETVYTEIKGTELPEPKVFDRLQGSVPMKRPSEQAVKPPATSPQPPASQPATTRPSSPQTAGVPPPQGQSQAPTVATSRPPAATPQPAQSAAIIGANPWKTLAVLGANLAFVEQGQGTPVVLVHGTLGDYRTWAPQVSEFSKWHQVISYSRRYHYPNLATGKEPDYTYERHRKDLTEFLRNLNAGPVHLVGQGYGAVVAAMVAAEHPEMLRSLVLIEPMMEEFLAPASQMSAKYEREEIFNIIRKPMRRGDFTRGVSTYHDWAREGPAWDQLRPDLQLQKRENGNSLTAQLEHASPPQFNCEDARRIKNPTLLISGASPTPFSKAVLDGLARCIAGSSRASVPNAGKAPNLDNPQEFNRVVMEWWARL